MKKYGRDKGRRVVRRHETFLFPFQPSASWRQPLTIIWDRSVLLAYIEIIFPFHCGFGDIPLKVSFVWRNV